MKSLRDEVRLGRVEFTSRKGAYRVRSTYRSPSANIESEGHIDALCRRKAQLSLPQVASEVHCVSEVLPIGKVANLTSLVRKHKLHCLATSLSQQRKLHPRSDSVGLNLPRAKAHIESEGHIDRPRRISSPKDISTRGAQLPTPSG